MQIRYVVTVLLLALLAINTALASPSDPVELSPTSHNDPSAIGTNLPNCYDKNLDTCGYWETDGDDVIEFLNFETAGGSIQQVDLVIRYAYPGSFDDTYEWKYFIAGVEGDDLMPPSTEAWSLSNRTWTAISEPNDGTWDWTDVFNLVVQCANDKKWWSDNARLDCYEVLIRVTVTAYERTVTETIVVTSTPARILTLSRDVTQSIFVADSVTSNTPYVSRLVVQSIPISDIASRNIAASRTTSESLTIVDSSVRTYTIVRSVTEFFSLSDFAALTDVWPSVHYYGTAKTAKCEACHGQNIKKGQPGDTCIGCHAHLQDPNDIVIDVSTDQAQYSPGEVARVIIEVSLGPDPDPKQGDQGNWVGVYLLDPSLNVIRHRHWDFKNHPILVYAFEVPSTPGSYVYQVGLFANDFSDPDLDPRPHSFCFIEVTINVV